MNGYCFRMSTLLIVLLQMSCDFSEKNEDVTLQFQVCVIKSSDTLFIDTFQVSKVNELNMNSIPHRSLTFSRNLTMSVDFASPVSDSSYVFVVLKNDTPFDPQINIQAFTWKVGGVVLFWSGILDFVGTEYAVILNNVGNPPSADVIVTATEDSAMTLLVNHTTDKTSMASTDILFNDLPDSCTVEVKEIQNDKPSESIIWITQVNDQFSTDPYGLYDSFDYVKPEVARIYAIKPRF